MLLSANTGVSKSVFSTLIPVNDAAEFRRLALRSATLDPEEKVVRVVAGLPDERLADDGSVFLTIIHIYCSVHISMHEVGTLVC